MIRIIVTKPKEKRVLDIGTSTGVMLDIFKENRWETWGVEPSESAKIAKEKRHKIVNKFFEKADLPRNYFDLVILNHTLEHMNDPSGVLLKVRGLLKKNGIIFVDVPNAGGLGARILGKRWPYLLPEEHKYQFTKESLQEVLEKVGFKIIHFESRSGIFEFANPFLELRRKRFILDLITIPYSLVATSLNMGDSMSMVGRKV